ncbi:hypothetical protein Geob_3323 [Geotalea daltonii FRC-32]|uniref:Uncharacterized protein n=1 Tax=Geotalea daltonii (strain DSM 22248 / JCM 15807 / FRC-32) TaxID=316067 RepID=B9M4Y2_GEODF|nr:hypothetical protein [Geotalea daltonii]ACM21666.1 hypothetical protein Geob_3323 [Geotalea daltonii FRC-32]
MIGLMFLAAFGIYLAFSIWVIKTTIAWAKRTGRGVRRWGLIASLVMYLLVFWDHLPTLLLYKYYCATKAGLWVYKTPEQWMKENPGVAETLTWKENSPQVTNGTGDLILQVNERFVWREAVSKSHILPVRISTETIVDTKKDEVMVKRVSIGAGYRGSLEMLKFWTSMGPCMPKIKEYGYYQDRFHRMGRGIK